MQAAVLPWQVLGNKVGEILMPVAEILAGVGALNNAIGIAKAIKDAESAYDKAALKLQLADIIDKLVDGKTALSAAREDLDAAEREIAELRRSFEEKATLVGTASGYKYKADINGKPHGWPVCPKCLYEGRIRELHQHGGRVKAKCPTCSSEYFPVHFESENAAELTDDERIAKAAGRLADAIA